MTDAFVAVERNGCLSYANGQAAKLLGKAAETLIGVPLWSEFPQAVSDALRTTCEHALVSNQPSYLEQYDAVRERWFECRIFPCPHGLAIYILDVSERKRAEIGLRTSEEQLRQLTENIQSVLWLADPDRRQLLYVSPAFETIWGRSRDSLNAAAPMWHDAIHPEDRERVLQVAKARQFSGSYDEEYRIVRPDGGVRWIRDRAAPICDTLGHVVRITGIAEDITDRKLADVALRQSQEYSLAILDSIVAEIAVLDAHGLITAVNQSWLHFGAANCCADASRCAGMGVGTNYLEACRAASGSQTDGGLQARLGIEAVLAGQVSEFSMEYDCSSPGEERWYSMTATPLGPNHHGVVVTHTDITQRKRNEEVLHENARQMNALSRRVLQAQETERRRVSRELHDELGQSLTAIKINLEAQQQAGVAAPADLNAENIRIVEDALHQVRNLALALRPPMLDDLGLVPALRWIAGQAAARCGFEMHFHSGLGLARFASETESACFRIVQEAFTNIARHAHAQRVDVDLYYGGAELVVSVQDDGCGFDVAAARRRANAGASVGVLGMQERAMLLGGQLEIRSAPGQGCTVCLHCPLRRQGEAL